MPASDSYMLYMTWRSTTIADFMGSRLASSLSSPTRMVPPILGTPAWAGEPAAALPLAAGQEGAAPPQAAGARTMLRTKS